MTAGEGYIQFPGNVKAKKFQSFHVELTDDQIAQLQGSMGTVRLTEVDVLDKGYVRYIKHMGDDLDVINSAKVSFAKEASSFEEREAKLLAFLAREEHTSVFRHSAVTFEVYAPLMVARQWWKYIVASSHTEDQQAWNESSRRYVTEQPTFYIPGKNEWRSAPDNKKQGSGEVLPEHIGVFWTKVIEDFCKMGEYNYNAALDAGICAEQARLFLPAYGMYIRWRWTASLGAILHFLQQRLEHDAQKEIMLYAQAVKELLRPLFPNTVGLIFDDNTS